MSEELKQGDDQANKNGQENDNSLNEEVILTDDEKVYLDEGVSKKWESISAQKKHWRDKHEKVNKDFEDYKKQYPPKSEKPEEKKVEKPDKKDGKDSTEYKLHRLELKQEYPTLSYEQLDKAINLSKVEGTSPQEVIGSDFFQSFVKIQAEKVAAEKSTPSPTNRSGSGSVDYDNLSVEQIRELSTEDYGKYQKHMLAKGGRSSGLRINHTNNL